MQLSPEPAMLKLPKPFRKQGQQLCSDGNTAVFFDAYNVDHMHDAYQQGLAEQPERAPLSCTWTQEDDFDMPGVYHTSEPLVFGMRGPKMTFTIGNQSFTLDYEPETTEEYVFMGNMLKAAISKLPRGVKIGAQPADPFKKLSDAQVLWLAESHGIDVYASNPLAFYADLIGTTPAQPDHSELVKDAARYRWLREQHWSDSKFAVVSNPKTAVNLGSICPSRELLDEAIDAAIGETMV